MSESADYDNSASDEDLKPDLSIREIDYTEEYTPEDDKEHRTTANNKHPHSKWHDEINKKLRLLIKSEITQENFNAHYVSYLTSLKEHLPFLLRNPKQCRLVAKKMSRTLLLFRSLYSNTTEIDLYNTKMCELLSILTTLELTYASNFDELKIEIVKRLCTNYDIHLRNLDATHILTVFLYLYSYYLSNMKQKKGWTIFDQTEILTKIFEKYLKKFPNTKQTKLNDKLYCMYIAAYSFWINVENDVYEKNNITRYANQVIAPKPSLRLNKTYFQYLAKYSPDEQNITKFIFDRGINRAGLVKILIEEDICKDVIINVECGEVQHPIINLDEDLTEKDFENLTITEEIKFKPTGQQSVVATIDLTEEKMEEDDTRKCTWLDKLIRLARQAKKSRRCVNKNPSNIEIINLDSDNDCEEDEENEEVQEKEEEHVETERSENLVKEKENCCDKQSSADEQISGQSKNAEIDIAQSVEDCEVNSDKQENNKTVGQGDSSKETEEKVEKSKCNDNCQNGKFDETNISHQGNEITQQIAEKEKNQPKDNLGKDENKKDQCKVNKTITGTEGQSQCFSVEAIQKDARSETTQKNVKNNNVDESKEMDKEKTVSTQGHLEKSITSSSNPPAEETLAEFVPIFDENLSFVTKYVTKTYSNKQIGKNIGNNSNDNEKNETHSEITRKEENSEQNREISNECNYEISSSTLLNDEYENENNNIKSAYSNKQRKVNPEKIVHRFFAPKKVNFAPLPEKHVSKNPVKYTSGKRMRRNSISTDKIQNSFIPPAGTEAFKLYESQKDSPLIKGSQNNLNNAQKSKNLVHVAGSTEKPVQIPDIRSASPFINFRVSSPTKQNITSESRPTAEAMLAATIHKSPGNGNISGTPYITNQHLPNNFLNIDRFTPQPRYQSKPNFYDYSLTKKQNNSLNLKHGYHNDNIKPMSDFDLYLLKLRESKKEADKQLRKEQRMIKKEKLVEKILNKKLNKTPFYNESKIKSVQKSSVINDILCSPKQLQVLIKRINIPITSKSNANDVSGNELLEDTLNKNICDDLTQQECIEESLPNEHVTQIEPVVESFISTDTTAMNSKNENSNIEVNKSHPIIAEEKSKSISKENHEVEENGTQFKDLSKNNSDLSKQNITDLVQNNVRRRGRKRVRNDKIHPQKTLKLNNISKTSLENENYCISYEALQNIVEKITNPHENNDQNRLVENENLSNNKRKFNTRRFAIKIKRLNFSRPISNIAANHEPEEITIVQCTSENTHLSNLNSGNSQEVNAQIEQQQVIVSENQNSSQINEQETNNAIDSNNENTVANNNDDDIVLNSLPRMTSTPSEIDVLDNLPNNDDPSNLIEHNVDDSNSILNNNYNKTSDTSGKSKDSSSQLTFKSSPKSDSYSIRKCYDNELEAIFRIKENEVTSTQESEVSSSLDLQSPITKRRKSRKSSLQDNEIPYSKDFALDCDDTASNAPTTTTIIDFVIANKKKRRKQKKFDTVIPNPIVNTIDQLKLTTRRKSIIVATKNLLSKNNKNNIRKLNKINGKGARKTYSKNNIVSTVFVPPDVEEMIHKDVEIQEIPKL